MSYFGKEFTLASQENFEQLVKTWPIPEDYKDKIINSKQVLKLVKDGDNYTFYATSMSKGGLRESKFKLGVEFDEEIKDGLVAKNVVTADGDTFTHVLTLPNGKQSVFKRTFSDNEVVVTITSTGFDGVAKRIYKA